MTYNRDLLMICSICVKCTRMKFVANVCKYMSQYISYTYVRYRMTTCDTLYRHNAYAIIRISYVNMTLNPILPRGSWDDGIWREFSLCLL